MALYSDSIPNLLNGVSQQAEILRHSSQARFQQNCYPSISDGLLKRPPLEWIAKILPGAAPEHAFYHIIDRGPTERYLLIIRSLPEILVYDIVNEEFKTVNAPNGIGYLVGGGVADAKMKAVTVADYTFLVNSGIPVAKSASTSIASQIGGVLVIRQGAYSCKYTLEVDGVGVLATKTTSDTDPADIRTDAIASFFATTVNGLAAWDATAVGNSVWIRKSDASNFTLRTSDSIGGDGMIWVKDKISDFSQLPPVSRAGLIVEVTGDPGTDFDNFYVQAVAQGSYAQGPVVWTEIGQPGVQNKLDPATMPYLLVRESDGTFTFKEATWVNRGAGNDDTNPFPSFLGETISDVFFYKNRLGFLAGESLISSQIGSYFAFFRETVTTKLDSDRIDVSVSTNEVAYLRYAVPYKERLLVFSDKIQFELKGTPTLTPDTANLDIITKYPARRSVRPVAAGTSVFFPFDRNQWTGVYEFFSDTEDQADAIDVSNHVPAFIPGTCRSICHAGTESALFLTTNQRPDQLFLYKYYWELSGGNSGREKVQSAWSYWKFPYDITNVSAVDHNIYVVMRETSGDGRLYLTSISLQPDIREPDMDFNILLDMKIRTDHADIESIVYDGGSDRTTFTLPYRWDDSEFTLEFVSLPNVVSALDASTTIILASSTVVTADYVFGEEALAGGAKLVQVSADGLNRQVVFDGDLTNVDAVIGIRYNAIHQFSNPVVKEQTDGGARTSITEGELILLFWTVNFTNSGWFSAKVFIKDQGVRQYIFDGPLATNPMPTGQLRSGRLKFPIRSNARAEDLIIELQNDRPYPSRWVNAGWEGNFVIRSRRF